MAAKNFSEESQVFSAVEHDTRHKITTDTALSASGRVGRAFTQLEEKFRHVL